MYLPWQETQWKLISAYRRAGRLPHAFLLSGPPGIGKYSFARNLANSLLCIKSDGIACGRCESCCLINVQSHPDLHEISPINKTITIDQIRDLTAALRQTAQRNYKIVILKQVECLSIPASGALLKTLEEPQSNTLFLLMTHKKAALLPTIISRCQILRFTAPSCSIACAWLQEQDSKLEKQTCFSLLSLFDWAPMQVLDFLKSPLLEHYKNLSLTLSDLIQSKTDFITVAEKYQAVPSAQLIDWLFHLTITLIKTKLRIPLETKDNRLTGVDLNFLLTYLSRLLEAQQQSRLYHLNPQLLYEVLFSYWVDSLKNPT
jgi:DNA polymerase III subunit delta'